MTSAFKVLTKFSVNLSLSIDHGVNNVQENHHTQNVVKICQKAEIYCQILDIYE